MPEPVSSGENVIGFWDEEAQENRNVGTANPMPVTLNGGGGAYVTRPIQLGVNDATTLVVAPSAGYAVWVYGFFGTGVANGTIQFTDGKGDAMTGLLQVVANGGFVVPCSPNPAQPWMKCREAESLILTAGACGFQGTLVYRLVAV